MRLGGVWAGAAAEVQLEGRAEGQVGVKMKVKVTATSKE